MIRLPFLIVFSLLFLTSFLGASLAADSPSISKNNIIYGKFSQQRFLSGFDTPFNSQGEYYLLPGKGIIWDLIHPFQSRLIITSTRMTQIVDQKEEDIQGASEVARLIVDLITPLLSSNLSALDKNFIVSEISPKGATHTWSLNLIPKSETLNLVITDITASGGDELKQIIIRKKDNDKDIIQFSEQVTNQIGDQDVLKLFGSEG